MKIKTKSEDGVIYQIEREFEEIGNVVIDVCYSGDVDENGKEILEFVYASIEEDANKDMSPEQIQVLNKELECGLEEAVILFLINQYVENPISQIFDIGEYKHNPTSVLYKS